MAIFCSMTSVSKPSNPFILYIYMFQTLFLNTKTLKSISRNSVFPTFEKRYLNNNSTNLSEIFRVGKAQVGECNKRWNFLQGLLFKFGEKNLSKNFFRMKPIF